MSADWKSPNKITARSGQTKGKGDIIVVTRSGGVGSSTVQYRGYHIQIGDQWYFLVLTYLFEISRFSLTLKR